MRISSPHPHAVRSTNITPPTTTRRRAADDLTAAAAAAAAGTAAAAIVDALPGCSHDAARGQGGTEEGLRHRRIRPSRSLTRGPPDDLGWWPRPAWARVARPAASRRSAHDSRRRPTPTNARPGGRGAAAAAISVVALLRRLASRWRCHSPLRWAPTRALGGTTRGGARAHVPGGSPALGRARAPANARGWAQRCRRAIIGSGSPQMAVKDEPRRPTERPTDAAAGPAGPGGSWGLQPREEAGGTVY